MWKIVGFVKTKIFKKSTLIILVILVVLIFTYKISLDQQEGTHQTLPNFKLSRYLTLANVTPASGEQNSAYWVQFKFSGPVDISKFGVSVYPNTIKLAKDMSSSDPSILLIHPDMGYAWESGVEYKITLSNAVKGQEVLKNSIDYTNNYLLVIEPSARGETKPKGEF